MQRFGPLNKAPLLGKRSEQIAESTVHDISEQQCHGVQVCIYIVVIMLAELHLQALQLGQDASSPFGFFNGQRCQMCLRSDPLHKVMERLANPGNSLSLSLSSSLA